MNLVTLCRLSRTIQGFYQTHYLFSKGVFLKAKFAATVLDNVAAENFGPRNSPTEILAQETS